MSEQYKRAGVDITAGYEAVQRMKKHVNRTIRPGVLGGLGGFGGQFALDISKYREPVLVSGTDGVGTKLMLAIMADRHDTIGIDAVAMCVNDIVVQGAEPLFFLDYIACGKLDPVKIEAIVKGVSDGCVQAGCALIGGETAEMPDMYEEDVYDIAGFSVGVVEKEKRIDGSSIQEGDAIIGIASSGLHSNGFSLVRQLLLKEANMDLTKTPPGMDGEQTLADLLLTPTKIYVRPLLRLIDTLHVKGLAHITGGGFVENIPRMLPEGVNADIERGSWPILPIFNLLEQVGSLQEKDLYRTFNMGIGMVAIVNADDAERAIQLLHDEGELAYRIGTVTAGTGQVTFDGEAI